MEKQITSNWYMVLIKGIIMILLALMVFSSPGGALVAYAIYLGIGLLLTGIVILYQGISSRQENPHWGWLVFEGALDLFLGYIILVNPLVTAAVLPMVIGFWAIFYGILIMIRGFSDTDNKMTKILSGILIIILGNIIMNNPVFAGLTAAIWVATLLLIMGIYNVFISFRLKNQIKKGQKVL